MRIRLRKTAWITCPDCDKHFDGPVRRVTLRPLVRGWWIFRRVIGVCPNCFGHFRPVRGLELVGEPVPND